VQTNISKRFQAIPHGNVLMTFSISVSKGGSYFGSHQARQNNQIWRIDRQSSLNASGIDLSF